MHYPTTPRALARILALGGVALGVFGLAAIPAQASVDATTASQMCATTYTLAPSGNPPEFDSTPHGAWKNQDRYIMTSRGGDFNASTQENVSVGHGSSTNNIVCDETYTYRDGFNQIEHIYITGGVAVGTYSDGSRYPAAYWTTHRSCDVVVNGATAQFDCAGF